MTTDDKIETESEEDIKQAEIERGVIQVIEFLEKKSGVEGWKFVKMNRFPANKNSPRVYTFHNPKHKDLGSYPFVFGDKEYTVLHQIRRTQEDTPRKK
jgi:hypothetical protein